MLTTELLLAVDKIPIAHPIEHGRIIYNDSLLPQNKEVNSELPFLKKSLSFTQRQRVRSLICNIARGLVTIEVPSDKILTQPHNPATLGAKCKVGTSIFFHHDETKKG